MEKSPQPRALFSDPVAVLTIALAAVLLALAVFRWRENGWGPLVWLGGFVASMAIRTPYALKNRANVVIDARTGATDVMLLVGMFLTMMLLPLLQLATGVFAFANYALPSWVIAVGVLLQVLYLWLFWRSHADLGRNWSAGLEVRQSHDLVTSGIYAHMRHPMYAAIWIAVLAQPLLIQNWIAGALVIPAFAAMWFIRVPNEEAMMRTTFGVAYDDYCARTRRLIPALRQLR